MTVEITAAVANYLRTVFDIEEDRATVRRARIAERLGHSKTAVAQMLLRMHNQGLVDLPDNGVVALTTQGRELSVALTRRHRLAERMLVDIVGLPRLAAHRVASGWELSMDAHAEQRLVHLLGYPATDAWGNSIPGLTQLGFHDSPILLPARPLCEVTGDTSPSHVSVQSFSEHLLNDECTVARLIDAGIEPGATITVVKQDAVVHLSATGSVTIARSIADSIHVTLLRAQSPTTPTSQRSLRPCQEPKRVGVGRRRHEPVTRRKL